MRKYMAGSEYRERAVKQYPRRREDHVLAAVWRMIACPDADSITAMHFYSGGLHCSSEAMVIQTHIIHPPRNNRFLLNEYVVNEGQANSSWQSK